MITSLQNPKLKLIRSLLGRAKARREEGAFLAEGVRLVEEAAAAGWPFRFVAHEESLGERGARLVADLQARGVECAAVSSGVMKSLSETETPQGVLAVLERQPLPLPETLDFVLIPDQIRDPGNLGTLLRTAVAAGVQAVLMPPETTDPFAPKVVRAGMGAHFRLPIAAMAWDEIERSTRGLHIYLADMHGTSCWDANLRRPLALVIGGEALGASEPARRLAREKLSIPMAGPIESLNAGVAGSVLMLEAARQRRQAVR